MNYFLQTAVSCSPDEHIGITGSLVINLDCLIQSLSGHLQEEADATDGKRRSILRTKANSVGMLLERMAVQVLGEAC